VSVDTEAPERVYSLAEIADLLNMKRSNVAKFLARRGVQPKFAKAQGYLYDAAAIEHVKAEREGDAERMAADERRRQAALHGPLRPPRPPMPRLGATQRQVLEHLRARPGHYENDAVRLALMRLRTRGYAEPVPGERGLWRLTPEGLDLAGRL